jgi:hypothetical protein
VAPSGGFRAKHNQAGAKGSGRLLCGPNSGRHDYVAGSALTSYLNNILEKPHVGVHFREAQC